jgi:hypothetical protein
VISVSRFERVIPSRADDEGPRSRGEDHAKFAFAIYEDHSDGPVAGDLCDDQIGCEVPRRLTRLGMTATLP